MADPALIVRGAHKHFGGVAALRLRGADLTLYPAQIHGLLGENGAGKSTLLVTLAGVHRLDSGEITFAGRPFDQGSTRRAREQGVAVIYQEPSLFPDLSIAENVFAGRQPTRRGRVDWAGMRSRTLELFARLGVHLDPDRRAAGLSIADQQLVEIVKALSTDAAVIVMDEPTAALSATEAARLLSMARRLRDRGRRWCSSATGWRRRSSSATGSPCCGTGRPWLRRRSPRPARGKWCAGWSAAS